MKHDADFVGVTLVRSTPFLPPSLEIYKEQPRWQEKPKQQRDSMQSDLNYMSLQIPKRLLLACSRSIAPIASIRNLSTS